MIRASIADQSDQTNTFPGAGNEGGTHEQGQLARHRHVDRLRRGQRGVAAAVGDRIDERRLLGAVLAEDIAGEVVESAPLCWNYGGLILARDSFHLRQ